MAFFVRKGKRLRHKTFIQLKNQLQQQLPDSFAGDDVRYPAALVRYFLIRYTRAGDTVLDPFAGFGTTLLTAQEMGRSACGLELDPQRVRYATQKLDPSNQLIHGDARILCAYDLPTIDFCMTSPPYMGRTDRENPFTAYAVAFQETEGYSSYLLDLQRIFDQVKDLLKPGARCVIEVANIKSDHGVTTLAWDIARTVSHTLRFEGELVIGWEKDGVEAGYGYGYDHSYCLIFQKSEAEIPTAPKKLVQTGYDAIVDDYQKWSQSVRGEERSRYTSYLLESLAGGADVLELGCATATLTTPLLAQKFRLTGVDVSAVQIEIARRNLPLSEFICADMAQIQFLPASFDAVVAFYSIIHLPRREHPQLLRRIAEWLRQRGLLVASFGGKQVEQGYEENWLGAPMYWSSYDGQTYIRLLEDLGFRIISARDETAIEDGEEVTFFWIIARKEYEE